jgi:nucleoside-diphosphate-sugar epimerase
MSLDHDGIVNIASGQTVKRQAVAKMTSDAIEYKGTIHFDEKPANSSLPLSGELAEKLMGWKASTPITDGLRVTADWYAKEREMQEAKT